MSFIYYKAFGELNGSRQIGFGGMGPIPYEAKIAWLNENQVHGAEERDRFIRILSHMDIEYLKSVNSKDRPKNKNRSDIKTPEQGDAEIARALGQR